jgi:hypothetical protein
MSNIVKSCLESKLLWNSTSTKKILKRIFSYITYPNSVASKYTILKLKHNYVIILIRHSSSCLFKILTVTKLWLRYHLDIWPLRVVWRRISIKNAQHFKFNEVVVLGLNIFYYWSRKIGQATVLTPRACY